MIQLKNLPLRTQIFLGVFITIIAVLLTGTLINFFIIRKEFVRTIDRDMENAFLYNLEKINNTTNNMISNGKSVALAGETFYYIYTSGALTQPEAVCERFLTRKVEQIPYILGSGLWYEPYLFAGKKFMGPYAYREAGQRIKITWEYNTQEYNYPSHEWYTEAIPLNWDRSKKRDREVFITRPYEDWLNGKKVIFLTMSIPMYNESGRIIGVSSTDWSVKVIQNYLSFLNKFSFTPHSFLMLLDGYGSKILYHTNERFILSEFSKNQLAPFVDLPSITDSKTRYLHDIMLNQRAYDVLYGKTDVGFYFFMAVPPSESYHRLTKTLIVFVLTGVGVLGIIFIFISRFINSKIILRILAINRRITEIEKGNYSGSLSFPENDELTHIAKNVQIMSNTILQRELQLTRLQHYLTNIIDSMPSMLIALDHEGVITQWNVAATRISGIPADKALGSLLWETSPHFMGYREHFRAVKQKGAPKSLTRETPGFGDNRIFNVSIFPLAAGGDSGVVFRFDDVTEAEQIELQLRQAQKLEIVGTLAGGLAHDFNNILSVIIGTTSILKYHFDNTIDVPRDDMKKSVADIDESAKRAADIVQQLLVLSSKMEMSFAPTDLNLSVKHVLKLCENTFDKSVEVEYAPFPTPAMTYADPVQIEQVILNLCVNANHAMTIMRPPDDPQGGLLSISVGFIHADEHFVKMQPEATIDTRYWMLSFRDTGIGIDQKIITKIFEPFFTTKQKNMGTGLGLSMVYTIIRQHNGFINVYSEPKLGSTFNVYLPFMEGDFASKPAGKSENFPTGSGLILVVEDEPAIRNAVRKILEICGYTVILTTNGDEALHIFSERHQDISLVLLDMVMPKRSGRDTFLAMKEIKSDVRVLLASGFRMDARVEEIMNLGVSGFIQKPYTIEKLASAIWHILNKK